MNNKVRYVLVFVLIVGFCQAYAQQSESNNPVQNSVSKDIQYVREKAEELQNKAFTKIDSLSNKSTNLLQTATDSLSNLSKAIEGKIKIDSLQQKLNEIKSNPPTLKSFGGQGKEINKYPMPRRKQISSQGELILYRIY